MFSNDEQTVTVQFNVNYGQSQSHKYLSLWHSAMRMICIEQHSHDTYLRNSQECKLSKHQITRISKTPSANPIE